MITYMGCVIQAGVETKRWLNLIFSKSRGYQWKLPACVINVVYWFKGLNAVNMAAAMIQSW